MSNHVNISLTQFDLLTEKQKEKEENLIDEFDRLISHLVYRKEHLKKAYDYYNGEYSEDRFQYLKDVYGTQTPTSVDFIPLVRTHIDKLIGEFLNDEINPGVTCKDSETLANINAERKAKINQEVLGLFQRQLSTNLQAFINGASQSEDKASSKHVEKLINDLERDFVSEYEISVKNVLEFLKNSNDVKLKEKLKILFIDILVAGQCYYSVEHGRKGEIPNIIIHSPFDVFIKKSPNEIEVNKGTASVVREWQDRREILMRYGRYMKKSDLDQLDRYLAEHGTEADVYYVRGSSGGLISGVGVALDSRGYTGDVRDEYYEPRESLFPVYKVERLAANEITLEDGTKDYRIDRYSGIRIGESVYINLGKDENVIRSRTKPLEAKLSLNGITFDDRAKRPYSLVLLTVDLQDKYNLLHFYRDHAIAISGTSGDHLDISTIPVELGEELPERIAKWVTYKKNGLALHNTSQEGMDGAGAYNTQYAGFDNSLEYGTIQAFDLAIQSTEKIVSYITGVFPEALGSYSEKDAVTNVQTGIKMSAIVTKQYFFMLNGVISSLLIDSVNACKVSFREGYVGSYILGNKLQKIFTISPQYFSFTDYDIHLVDIGEHAKDLETIRSIALELVQAGTTDIDILLDLIGSKSLTAAKTNVGNAVKKSREENSQLQQMAEQMRQLEQQVQEAQRQLEEANRALEQSQKEADEIAKTKLQYDYEIAKDKIEIEKMFKTNQAKNADKRTELEEMQLYDNNPYNNKVVQ